MEHDALNAFLSRLVENALAQLEDAQCLTIGEDDSLEPATLGRIASFYYLQHPSVALFASSLGPDNSLEQLLGVLCGVAEYDELPVRHNEDKVNAELARQIEDAGGFKVDARLADDPHTKANLLFQAHFLRMQLPMSDYVTDTKSVLDQALRVLQASGHHSHGVGGDTRSKACQHLGAPGTSRSIGRYQWCKVHRSPQEEFHFCNVSPFFQDQSQDHFP